jgi:hypothetical protein
VLDQFHQADTLNFLINVLNVKNTITVKTEVLFQDPIKLINDIIDEVLRETIQNVQKKLAEGVENKKDSARKSKISSPKS